MVGVTPFRCYTCLSADGFRVTVCGRGLSGADEGEMVGSLLRLRKSLGILGVLDWTEVWGGRRLAAFDRGG